MREITNITPEGVTYIDEEGNSRFIDFETCHQNNIRDVEQRWGDRFTDERKEFWQEAKYVGVRYSQSDPPNIAFYTVPLTKFEFPTKDDLYKVAAMIKKAGWRTNDGD